METTMGRVTTRIRVENFHDRADPGRPVRAVEIDDALVDTGATFLCLPPAAIRELGLIPIDVRRAMTANGPVETRIYGGAFLTIAGRSCTVDVMDLQEGVPALVGYIPLEILDYVVDPKAQKLIPNPAHGGQWTMDLF